MMIEQLLLAEFGEKKVKWKVPLKEHLSFRVGGDCKAMIFPETVEEIKGAIALCNQEKVKYFILGKGTNLIASDEGYDGVVIKLSGGFEKLVIQGNLFTAQAGASLSALAKKALENGLTGLEFAAGIPGTLGGAVMMNAGAYDGEIKDVISEVTFLDEYGEIRTYTKEQCDFSYRNSVFQEQQGIILSAQLILKEGNAESIREKMEDFARRRSAKQPLTYPSAGSTFKRPEGYFAGKLIQDAGLMGLTVGGAMISDLHAGFIINKGNATAKDILDLIELVRHTVNDKFGVMLEPEVKLLK